MKRTLNLPCLMAAMAAVLMLALPTSVWAVGVTTTTYASDTGDPAYKPHPQPGPNTPQTNSQTLSDPIGPLSSNITSNVTTAHAQAWGTAKVTAAGVTKSASGRSWIDAVNPTYDGRAFTWSALATGTQLELHWNGDPTLKPAFAQMELFVPASFDDGYDATMQAGAPGSLPKPTQGFYTDAASAPSGSASYFNLNFNINAAYSDATHTVPVTQFQGGGVLHDANVLTVSGDLGSNVFRTDDFNGRTGLGVTTDTVLKVLPMQIPFDTPFDMDFSVYMSMGDPNNTGAVNPDFGFGSIAGPLGGSGSLGVILRPTDASISVSAVPEPSSIALLVLGLLGLAAVGRRRLRAA